MNTKDLLTQRFWLVSRLESGQIADITGQRAALSKIYEIDQTLERVGA